MQMHGIIVRVRVEGNFYFYNMLMSHQDTHQINCPNEKQYSSTHQNIESAVSDTKNAKIQ
jgi:hypothetical protein